MATRTARRPETALLSNISNPSLWTTCLKWPPRPPSARNCADGTIEPSVQHSPGLPPVCPRAFRDDQTNSSVVMHTATFLRDHSCLGPELILEDYRRVLSSQPEGAEDSGFFWNSFDQIVARFNLNADTRDDKLAHAIIKRDVSPSDSCMQPTRWFSWHT